MSSSIESVDNAIKSRKTEKVLANDPWPITTPSDQIDILISDMLDLAAMAPYHKRNHTSYIIDTDLDSCVPWRFYVLDTERCRALYQHIVAQDISAGKVSNMLCAADVLFLVTWLPDPNMEHVVPSENRAMSNEQEPMPYVGNLRHMEHIAAASAAIQNVLIGATARDIPNYWSTGGKLRQAELRNHLGIPMKEILLGALFLFPKDTDQREGQIKPGKLRYEGKELTTWSKRV